MTIDYPEKTMTVSSRRFAIHNSSGFTIIELLIAVALLAVVSAAAFTLYNMQHRVTHIEEDVVDVQQNLRMAVDSVSKDLRMAGLVITGGTNPIAAVANNSGTGGTDSITINTASATGELARIAADLSTNVTSAVDITFTLASAREANQFSIGDVVRTIDVGERGQHVNATYTVSGVNATTPSLTVTPAGAGTSILFKNGSIIAKTGAGAFPNTVQYCVGPAAGCGPAVTTCPAGQNCLLRITNGAASDNSVVATNITDFQLTYVEDGSTAEVDLPANIVLLRAVRVSVNGQTADTASLSGGAKSREITTVAKIRNR